MNHAVAREDIRLQNFGIIEHDRAVAGNGYSYIFSLKRLYRHTIEEHVRRNIAKDSMVIQNTSEEIEILGLKKNVQSSIGKLCKCFIIFD